MAGVCLLTGYLLGVCGDLDPGSDNVVRADGTSVSLAPEGSFSVQLDPNLGSTPTG
jgi:hypothetical protein